MAEELSLREYCIPCKSKCCQTGDSIASPILDHEEVRAIYDKTQQDVFREVTTPSGVYYLIREQEGTNRCAFLTPENKCRIQDTKPLDCLCYPIKAAYDYYGGICFVIDEDCSAAKHLTSEFIKKAKEIALKSLLRFNKGVYQHWIDNQELWVKGAARLDDFLDRLHSKE